MHSYVEYLFIRFLNFCFPFFFFLPFFFLQTLITSSNHTNVLGIRAPRDYFVEHNSRPAAYLLMLAGRPLTSTVRTVTSSMSDWLSYLMDRLTLLKPLDSSLVRFEWVFDYSIFQHFFQICNFCRSTQFGTVSIFKTSTYWVLFSLEISWDKSHAVLLSFEEVMVFFPIWDQCLGLYLDFLGPDYSCCGVVCLLLVLKGFDCVCLIVLVPTLDCEGWLVKLYVFELPFVIGSCRCVLWYTPFCSCQRHIAF